jgi:hypothetical protein
MRDTEWFARLEDYGMVLASIKVRDRGRRKAARCGGAPKRFESESLIVFAAREGEKS